MSYEHQGGITIGVSDQPLDVSALDDPVTPIRLTMVSTHVLVKIRPIVASDRGLTISIQLRYRPDNITYEGIGATCSPTGRESPTRSVRRAPVRGGH
jgi:hypothetical protein